MPAWKLTIYYHDGDKVSMGPYVSNTEAEEKLKEIMTKQLWYQEGKTFYPSSAIQKATIIHYEKMEPDKK